MTWRLGRSSLVSGLDVWSEPTGGYPMKKLLAVSAAVAALGCAPAFAADVPVKAPIYRPAPLWDWTGFYIGVNGGAGWGTVEAAFAGLPLAISSPRINGF